MKLQSGMSYAPNLTNAGYCDLLAPSQFKKNYIESFANPTQKMYFKCTMRGNLTMSQQFCDPDELSNGYRYPDPNFDFCSQHQQIVASVNQYLYESEEGRSNQFNLKITLNNTIEQNDTFQQIELKKYQEIRSIMEAEIPIQYITRQHPKEFPLQYNRQIFDSEEQKNIFIRQQPSRQNQDLVQSMSTLLLQILYKKPIKPQIWTEFKNQLNRYNQEITNPAKQMINIFNIFSKREGKREIKQIAEEIQQSKELIQDLRFIVQKKEHVQQLMQYFANNQQKQIYEKKDEIYITQNISEHFEQINSSIISSKKFFSYDEGQICKCFYEYSTKKFSLDEQEMENFNYFPLQLLSSSGQEQKWLVIDLKAAQSKLNEYDSDEDLEEPVESNTENQTTQSDKNNQQIKSNAKKINQQFKLKVLSIYQKETNGQFSKHKEAVSEIKGSQKCAYNIDSTTIATNYYQFSFEKMRLLNLTDTEMITVMYLSLQQLHGVFKNGFHFINLNPNNIFLHIKTTGSQKFKVKFHIDSSCFKPAQYYQPTYTPGFIQSSLIPSTYDDMQKWRLQSLYSLFISLLNIITSKPTDIYDFDPVTIFKMKDKKGEQLKKKYPKFIYYLSYILKNKITDSLDIILNQMKKDYIDKNRIDFTKLLHNNENTEKIIDIQKKKFQSIAKEFFTPKRIFDRIFFFCYTNQYQKVNLKGETEKIYKYITENIDLLEQIIQDQSVKYPAHLTVNKASFYLLKILLNQYSEAAIDKQVEILTQKLQSNDFNENQLNPHLKGKNLIRFYINNNNVEYKLVKMSDKEIIVNLINKFVIQILKDKPRLCEKFSVNDIPSKIKLKLNERRFTEVQNLIDNYYSVREKLREGITQTPIKLINFEEMINCRIGTKRIFEAYGWTNECFELRLSLFGWENVESANGCNSVGYVLFYLRKIKESQFYVEQAIFWSVAYKGTDNAELATAYNNIAYLVMNNNEVENSLRYHYKALKIRKQLHPKGHNDLGSTYNNIGQNLTRLKKNNESLIYYQKAMNVWIRLMGYKHNTVSLALSNIANTYTAMGKYDHSIIFHRISYLVRYQTLYQDSKEQIGSENRQQFVQINNHDLAITLDNIGFTYTKQEKYDEAIKVQELGKKMWKELNIRNKTHLQSFVVSLNNLCNTQKKQGNFAEAFNEVYETKKIIEESKDQNLNKNQNNYIRQIKAEINRHVIQTLRQVNQYLQVNQTDSAIALLFKIAYLYDQILSKIQQVDGLNKKELNDPIKLPSIRSVEELFPYIILYKNQTILVKLPPRCFNDKRIDNIEKDIQNEINNIVQSNTQSPDTIQNDSQNQTTAPQESRQIDEQRFEQIKSTLQTRIVDRYNQDIKTSFEQNGNNREYTNVQQLIMILLIQSIGDILFAKIVKSLQDNDFFKQSKEILTELKYIIDAHITSNKKDINTQFSSYKRLFASRR